MTKAEFEVGGQQVEIDFSEMEQRMIDKFGPKMEEYFQRARKLAEQKHKEEGGKGVVESYFPDDKKTKIIETFKKGERMSVAEAQSIKEQWTICVPYYAQNELAGHLRDYVWVTDVVKGKKGETVNIPTVKDVDFEHLTVKTGSMAGVSGLINVLTTTLMESGTYYDAYYGDIEKIDSNMLDELNRVFAHAAIRAEDEDLIDVLDDITTAQFSGVSGLTRVMGGEDDTDNIVLGDTAGAGSSFQFRWVADGIGKLLQRGKEVRPGECILIMGVRNYKFMLKDLVASSLTSVGYGRSDIIQKGVIEDWLGVKIVVTHARPSVQQAASSYEQCYMIRPKRALALAPKRDILIETDKLIKERQLRIAASHTYGVTVIDPTEVVRYCTGAFHTKSVANS